MSVLDLSPVIPVVVLDDPLAAVPVARALLAGGITIIEVTLRTPVALACIERIAAEVPEITVGAGTVLRPGDAVAAIGAGAGFLVSPGTTPELVAALHDMEVPSLPGCSTVSEALHLRDRGFTEVKFFPAEAAGGVPYLAATAAVLPEVRFCPTGGITLVRAHSYLTLPNVPCVGGTWLAPAGLIAEQSWARVTELAAAAVATLGLPVEAV